MTKKKATTERIGDKAARVFGDAAIARYERGNHASSSTADRIALLIANAPALRNAGVLSLSIDGLSATFTPPLAPQLPQNAGKGEPPKRTFATPLHDPDLYANGVVPGFKLDEAGQ